MGEKASAVVLVWNTHLREGNYRRILTKAKPLWCRVVVLVFLLVLEPSIGGYEISLWDNGSVSWRKHSESASTEDYAYVIRTSQDLVRGGLVRSTA